jgi:hypothetical protein
MPSPGPHHSASLRSLCRTFTERAVRQIAYLMDNSKLDQVRLGAANTLLDRGWGKPQVDEEARNEGITIVIRKILENHKFDDEPPPVLRRAIESQANGNAKTE